MDPKDFENGAQIEPGGAKMEAKVGPDTPKFEKKQQRNNEHKSTSPRRPLFTENVANMAPTWHPKWSQNEEKIDPKNDPIWGCFRDRVFFRF